MNNPKHHLLLFFFISFASVSTWAESLRSIVQKTSLSLNDTIKLEVQYKGNNAKGNPDFSQLSKDFSVQSGGVSSSTSYSLKNDEAENIVQWTFYLTPKKEGKLFIPSFNYQGLISDAVELSVSPEEKTAKNIKEVFLETIINDDEVYVQEEIIVKYRLYFSVNISGLDTTPFNIDNVLQEKLPDVRYRKSIGGRPYEIAEFSFVFYPQESGELVIPDKIWDVKVSRSGGNRTVFGFSGRTENMRFTTEGKTITVKPRPDAFPKGSPWLPAKKLVLSEQWSQDTANFKVGEPLTRKIRLAAEGLMSSQLPQIWENIESDTLKTYADQPELNQEATAHGFKSERIESAAVVLSSAQPATLPEISIPWWDTEADVLRYAKIKAHTFQAKDVPQAKPAQTGSSLPSELANAVTTNTEELEKLSSQLKLWQFMSALFMALSCLFGVLWWRKLKQPLSDEQPVSKHTYEKSAFKKFQQACHENDARKIRESIIVWANSHWKNKTIQTLDELAKTINDAEIKKALHVIDAHLYSENDSLIDGSELFERIKRFVAMRSQNLKDSSLKEFYGLIA